MNQYIKEIGKKGYLTYKFNNQYIYSSYDPYKEAQIFLDKNTNLKKYIITCCGADFINKLLVKKNVLEIISYEPIKFDILETSPLIKRFSTIEDILSYLSDKNLKDYTFIFWQKLLETNPEIYLENIKKIVNNMEKNIFSKNTENIYNFIEIKNFIYNIHKLTEINILKPLINKLSNPAIILSSGYSLIDNIDFINEVKNKCILFALPSALPFLYHNKIFPDYVIAVDPGYATYYHLSKYKYPINLICPLTINPSIFNLKNIKPIIFSYQTEIENIIFKDINIIKTYAEGSVINNTLRLLPQININEVILIGQDFGYKNNRSHINEGIFENEYLSISNYFSSIESKIKIIESIKDLTFIDNNKTKIKTDSALKIYYNHFIEQNFKIKIFLTSTCFNFLKNKFDFINSDFLNNKYESKLLENNFYILNNINSIKNNLNHLLQNIFGNKTNNFNSININNFNSLQKYLFNKYQEKIINVN